MTREEMIEFIDDIIDEFSYSGKHSRTKDGHLSQRRTMEEFEDLRRRLRDFFEQNDVPKDIAYRFARSGIGAMYYQAYGHSITDV